MKISSFPEGLDVSKSMNLDAINNENPAFERIIRGYTLDYRLTQFGGISVTRLYKITQWQGNQPKDFRYGGSRVGVDSDVVWNIQIISPGEGLEAPVIQLIDGNEQKGFVLFARLFHADVLPGIAADDILRIKPFFQAVSITVADKGSEKNQMATPGLLLPADLAASENNEKLKMQVFVAGEIISVDHDNEFAPGVDFMLIKVKTPIGLLPLALKPAVSGENLKPLLKKGNLARATGWLFGDAAAGQYASGMVLDLEHDLRLLGFGARGYDFSRTRQIFSETCQYFTKDELRAEGPEAVVEALNGVAKVAKERKYASNFVYGQILLKNGSKTFQQNEKCLVFLDDDGQLYFLMCARTDESGRISKLFTVYSSDEIEELRTTTDFQLWCEGFSDAPAPDAQTEADKKLPAYYENPDLSDQLHGDRDAFFGEPFFGFGDMLDILMPGEDAEIMAKVIQWAGEAQLAGHYQSGSFKGAYLDYPESNARLGMQFALGKNPDQKSFQMIYFYPFMQGHRQSLKIVGTFDWPEKVCGYIAAKWRDKAPINCFAPSYRLWNEKIIFDQPVELALSGLAVDIGPVPNPYFTVEKGQFYEMNLAQFLYENPDKTISDFEAPVVHTEDSVLFIPRGETCIYELQAPVKKVESVKFDEKDFTRLLMPIARDLDDDGELLAWIYASDKEMGDFRPKPGDPVACVIWLCASWVD